MTKLVLRAQPAAFNKYIKPAEEPVPLASTYGIKYRDLLSKIDKLRTVSAEDIEYYVTEKAASTTKEVIGELYGLNVLEKNIAVYLLSNLHGGIQIELDGRQVKADIEILGDGNIVLTTYKGSQNTTEEYQLTIGYLSIIVRLFDKCAEF